MSHYDLIIIGAGAAGLSAARRLQASGRSCLVLEARERPGGRAWTVTLANGAIADLGCGWLHSADENPLAPLVAAQGLTLDKTPPPWSRPDALIGPNAAFLAGFGEAMMEFRDAVEDWRGPDMPASALVRDTPYAPLLDAVSTYYSGAELAKVSLLDLQTYADSGVNWRVREGLGALIASLAQGLPVRYGCPVRRIDHSGLGLKVETTAGALTAHAVIVTLPSNVLAQTPDLFHPALPEKTQAASRLPLGLANKLYIAPARAEDFPIEARAFGRIDRAATAAYHFRPLGAPLIEAYFGGDYAEAVEADAFAFAREELIGLFGANIAGGLRPMAFHGWRGDVYARGSYSYAAPGHASARAVLAEPVENRLFFAGEACSRFSFSTAHGAYATGLQAAEEALAALERRGD